jgi:uncharacterized protein (UPF0248 family)
MSIQSYDDKKAIIFFDDLEKVSQKEGYIEDITDYSIVLRPSNSQTNKITHDIIPKHRIVRIELLK